MNHKLTITNFATFNHYLLIYSINNHLFANFIVMVKIIIFIKNWMFMLMVRQNLRILIYLLIQSAFIT